MRRHLSGRPISNDRCEVFYIPGGFRVPPMPTLSEYLVDDVKPDLDYEAAEFRLIEVPEHKCIPRASIVT
jgi:hypothetical protein